MPGAKDAFRNWARCTNISCLEDEFLPLNYAPLDKEKSFPTNSEKVQFEQKCVEIRLA